MQTTTKYGFKKPEEGDYALISDINDNMDAIDEELASPTGDLAEATVETLTAFTAEYPVPAASDSLKVIIGKITKFFADIVQTFTGATASAAGHKGLVPAPAKNTQNRYLRADGTWQEPVNDNTTTVAGRALDARQANPNVSGSLGAQLKSLNDSFRLWKNYTITYTAQAGVSDVTVTLCRRGFTGVWIISAQLSGFTSSDYVKIAEAAGMKQAVDFRFLQQATDGNSVFIRTDMQGNVYIATYGTATTINGRILVTIPMIFDLTTDD